MLCIAIPLPHFYMRSERQTHLCRFFLLQTTRIASRSSTIIRFQIFLTRSLSPFWDPCPLRSTIPLQSYPRRLLPLPPPHYCQLLARRSTGFTLKGAPS